MCLHNNMCWCVHVYISILVCMFYCIQEYHTRQLDLIEPPDGFNSTRGVKETVVTASEFKVCVGGACVCVVWSVCVGGGGMVCVDV